MTLKSEAGYDHVMYYCFFVCFRSIETRLYLFFFFFIIIVNPIKSDYVTSLNLHILERNRDHVESAIPLLRSLVGVTCTVSEINNEI